MSPCSVARVGSGSGSPGVVGGGSEDASRVRLEMMDAGFSPVTIVIATALDRSGSNAKEAASALLTIGPKVATRAVTWSTAVAPLARVPTVHSPLAAEYMPCEGVTEMKVNPGG